MDYIIKRTARTSLFIMSSLSLYEVITELTINVLNNAINIVISANLISIGSQVSTKDQLLLPRMRYGNAYNMSAIAIHKHKVSQLENVVSFDLRRMIFP